jgi:hypothetical protein
VRGFGWVLFALVAVAPLASASLVDVEPSGSANATTGCAPVYWMVPQVQTCGGLVAIGATGASGGLVSASPTGSANGGAVCVVVATTPPYPLVDDCASGLAASATGSASNGLLTASGTGNAATCPMLQLCTSVSALGSASGHQAVSVAGDASDACWATDAGLPSCVVVSGTGDASVTCDDGCVAASGTGHASGPTAVSGCDEAWRMGHTGAACANPVDALPLP